jgi:DNA-binding NtrC family response regulator
MQELVNTPLILIASNDNEYSDGLTHFLQASGLDSERCHDAQGVYREVRKQPFEILILDLALLDEAHADLISFVMSQTPLAKIVLIFDMEHMDRALDGLRHGAFFYLPKSSPPSDVVMAVGKALHEIQLKEVVLEHEQHAFEELVGNTPAMRRVIELVTKVAPTDSTMLLLGESGTGKEVIANMIHRISPRRENPFVAINCAALPEQILESELFGHVKGAFTGAESDKAGLFEEADGGTLFLDEVGDMALVAQAKLLRVLQNGEIRRVGENVPRHVDVRILAATNKDLVNDVANKTFREDLYFRLNVIQIQIPPLRERRDAIEALVKQFIKRGNQQFDKHVFGIEDSAWGLLQHYEYPGNIRELESIIAHAVILADSDQITVNDLPDQLRFGEGARLSLPAYEPDTLPTIEVMEKGLIERTLIQLDGNQTEVAKSLGISRSTLWRKMKDFGIPKNT